jgi:hypothetical protein
MISKSISLRLIRECEGLDFFPHKDSPALDVLVLTLANRSSSEAHARQIVDRWLSTQIKAPKPADIVALVDEISDPASKPSPTEACERCLGAPFITTNYSGQGFAGRCTCARGRYLLSREREERAKRAA